MPFKFLKLVFKVFSILVIGTPLFITKTKAIAFGELISLIWDTIHVTGSNIIRWTITMSAVIHIDQATFSDGFFLENINLQRTDYDNWF